MKIHINGQEREFADGKTLSLIIQELLKDKRHVIAEHNGNIVRQPHWEQTLVQDGDCIELVTFVGGG